MNITVTANTTRISPMKSSTWARPGTGDETPAPQAQDQIEISQKARQTLDGQEELSPIEKALQSTTKEDIIAMMKEWEAQHPLEINWNAAVDPDGSVYAKSYMESLAGRYDSARQTIEAYYAEGHQENLRFSNPYNHLVEKYKYSGSPYFRGDMSEAQRDMAFRQEEALLFGRRVALNDPWALAEAGGVLKGEDVEKAARAYAQSVLDGLIAEYKKAHNIEE